VCGFSVILSQVETEGLDQAIRRMTETLAPRGPDGAGVYVSGRIAMGHRRLSIRDLTPLGAQPMSIAALGITVVFNGEIYNYSDLKHELLALGSKFFSSTDTEVILHAYANWGLKGLRKLEGIFSFSLWDQKKQRLVLMRDRFGVKPLFFGRCKYGLAVGSEIKAVLAAGGIDRTMDEQALREYLWYGNTYDDRTIFRGVRALKPGYWFIKNETCEKLEPWWRVEDLLDRNDEPRTQDDAVELTRAAIDKAVKRQLVSDVPIGIFLSGGLDSSAIAAAAVRAGGDTLQSFAAGFDFAKGVNELPKAAIVARHLRLQHEEMAIGGENLAADVIRLAIAHDEPFADAANIPLYQMCRALNGRLKVVLQGDGGDEIFGGYRRYVLLHNMRKLQLVPQWLISIMSKYSAHGRRFGRISHAVGQVDPAIRMALLLTTEIPQAPPEAFFLEDRRDDLEQTSDPFLAYRSSAERFSKYDAVQQMLLTDLTLQLPSQFLTKVDRATMAFGVEARVPLLDEGITELVIGLPARWKVSGTIEKILLRKVLGAHLPKSITNAPKTGFGVPYGHWLRTELRTFALSRLLDESFTDKFSISPQKIETAFREHQMGIQDRSNILWKLLNLQIWNSLQETDIKS
jgi:asparagine synthase (glutamine-hydrolysing)